MWYPNVHYRCYKRPSLTPDLCQLKPLHEFPFYFFNIYVNILLLSLSGSLKRFPCFWFSNQKCVSISCLFHACHILHPLLLNYVIFKRRYYVSIFSVYDISYLFVVTSLYPIIVVFTRWLSNLHFFQRYITIRDFGALNHLWSTRLRHVVGNGSQQLQSRMLWLPRVG